MRAALGLLVILAAPSAGADDAVPAASDALVRQRIAEVALAQLAQLDPAWSEAQRDCAGLVRFAYRSAFATLRPAARGDALFLDDHGRPSAFADAETLVTKSFVPLGRGDDARHALRSGDVLAFRAERADGEVVWHLMLAVVPEPGVEARLVYHPGEPGAALRTGTLAALLRDAPLEWRPSVDNPAFLGFFRYRGFVPATGVITTNGGPT
jgi:uncharacterized protein YfaT (DUF1175 family)